MTPPNKSLPLFPTCIYCGVDCLVGYGYCHCGCGEKTKPSPQGHKKKGVSKGDPLKYILYHLKLRSRILFEEKYDCVCGTNNCGIPYGICHCGCGYNTPIAEETRLSVGRIKGKPRAFIPHHHKRKHGQCLKSCASPAYKTWTHMIQRCTNPDNQAYKDYGGRGISICDRWMIFETFYEDMGERPESTSLDRINVNGNYEPGNCRWATQEVQHNNKRSNVYLEYEGERLSIAQLSRKTGMSKNIIKYRVMHKGMSVEEAISMGSERGNARHSTVDSVL